MDLGFSITGEHSYVYELRSHNESWRGDEAFGYVRATAYGDLDCDAYQSTFTRLAYGRTTPEGCDAEIVPGEYVKNPGE